MFVFLCWNDAAEDRCLHTHRPEMFRYIYLCNMKYIAQSVPIFTTADLIEYHCFFWSSSFPLDLFHFIKLLLCSILEYAYKHYSYCFHIASSSCTANLTYLTLIQAKLNHQWCYTHTHTQKSSIIYILPTFNIIVIVSVLSLARYRTWEKINKCVPVVELPQVVGFFKCFWIFLSCMLKIRL